MAKQKQILAKIRIFIRDHMKVPHGVLRPIVTPLVIIKAKKQHQLYEISNLRD